MKHIKALKNLTNQLDFYGIESMALPQTKGDITLPEVGYAFPDKVILPNFPANLYKCSNEGMKRIFKGIVFRSRQNNNFYASDQ